MKKFFKFIPLILIITFLGLYIAYESGYYDKMIRNKIELTNEEIEKFEQDILNGNDVTINKYHQQDKDYSTKMSKMSLKMSNKLENIVDSGIKYLFRKISKMVE